MKLKDLPKEIQGLAVKRAVEQKETPLPESKIFVIIDWTRTQEGWKFWNEINKGNFDVYYQKYGSIDVSDKVEKAIERIDNTLQGFDHRLKKLEGFDKIKDEIWQNIKREIDKEEKLDNHYQIGDRFSCDDFREFDIPYVLASIDDDQAVLINLNTGGNWKSPVKIKTPGIVTKNEALEIGIQDMKKKI